MYILSLTRYTYGQSLLQIRQLDRNMRPNIDISWSLHGDVKEHSERTGKSIEEAYVNIIKRGLNTVSDRTRRFTTETPTDVVFSPIQEELGVGGVTLFSNFGEGIYDDPTVVRIAENNIATDQAEGILAELYHRFVLDQGKYSIHQKNAAWYGDGGVGDFFYWLDNLSELYRQSPEDYDVDYHRAASAAFIGSAPFPAKHVLVYATASRSGNLEKFGIEFVIDGFPIEGGEFSEFADTVGVSLSHAETWSADYEAADELQRVDIGADGPITLNRKLTREGEEEVIEGVVCENPFYRNEEAAERTFEDAQIQRAAQAVKLFPGRLKHTADEDMRYDLFATRFGFSNLRYLTRAPFSLINVNFEANW